jgi:hypothetical protein
MIAIDGKPDPKKAAEYIHGLHVGRWEGDTLVLDSIGFSDETWLRRLVSLRPDAGHREVHAERNELLYEVTVEDPEVLVKPWVMPACTLRFSRNRRSSGSEGCTESEPERGLHALVEIGSRTPIGTNRASITSPGRRAPSSSGRTTAIQGR